MFGTACSLDEIDRAVCEVTLTIAGLFVEVGQELFDEERIAGGLAVNMVGERGDVLHAGAVARAHQPGHVVTTQPVEAHLLDAGQSQEIGDGQRQKVVGIDIGLSQGADQHHVRRFRVGDHVLQQADRRLGRPVQIVDDEKGRRIGRHVAQQARGGFEQSVTRHLGIGGQRFGYVVDAASELR